MDKKTELLKGMKDVGKILAYEEMREFIDKKIMELDEANENGR